MNVENVRVILERTFEMPVAESDAQIVLDRLVKLQAEEAAEQKRVLDSAYFCPKCGASLEKEGWCEQHGLPATPS